MELQRGQAEPLLQGLSGCYDFSPEQLRVTQRQTLPLLPGMPWQLDHVFGGDHAWNGVHEAPSPVLESEDKSSGSRRRR